MIKDIENYIATTLATQWRKLGEQLNIDQSSLAILQHNYPNDCEECCNRMLADWLEQNTHENTTWEILINAIDRLPTGIKSIIIRYIYGSTVFSRIFTSKLWLQKVCLKNNII